MAATRSIPANKQESKAQPEERDVFEVPDERDPDAPSQAVLDAQQRIVALEEELNTHILDRRSVIHGALVALVARQHMVLLGPPGEAKSALIDAICGQIEGSKLFKILLTRFTNPEEVFGPVSIKGLKEDRYKRMTPGYFPEAHVAFLDEIFKAGSSILNTFLMAMNEREFRNDGALADIPLVSVFGASNEMPQGEDLGALWDRMSLRYWVDPLSGSSLRRFMFMKRDQAAGGQTGLGTLETTISLQDLALLQERAVSLMGGLSERVFSLYEDITRELHAKGLKPPSTRRTGWALQMVAANAVVAGRKRVTETDLTILGNMLWDDVKSWREVNALVIKMSNPRLAEANEKYDAVLQTVAQVLEEWKKKESQRSERNAKVIEGRDKIIRAGQDILKLSKEAEADGADESELTEFKAILANSKQAFKEVSDLLGQDPTAAWA